ncbi:hypothetical protein [Crossiella sp. NPDC003009]
MSTASIAGILVMLPALVGIAILWRWSAPGLAEPKPLPQPRDLLAKARQAAERFTPQRRAPIGPRIGAHRSRVPRYAPMPTMPSVAELRAREDADHLSYYPRLRRD